MTLIGNITPYTALPGRQVGGVYGGLRSAWNTNGASANRFGASGYSKTAAVPNGCRPPQSWLMPRSAGALVSRGLISGTGSASASGAGGRNAAAALTGSGSITNALAGLIVSASATLTGSGAITDAGVLAFLNAAATLAGSGNLTGAIDALGELGAVVAGSGSVNPTLTATGELGATITPFTELSPQSLAAAVWASPEGQFLYALGHNKVVTDPVAGTYTVYADDDVTVLYTADLWADAAGTTPYSGSGAERRDRLT